MDARRQQFLSVLAPALAEAAARRTDDRRPKPAYDRRTSTADRRQSA